MAKKDYGDNPFNKQEEETPMTVTEQIFGKVAVPESGREVVKPIDIMSIYPDSSQPRRAIPMKFRQGWHGQPNKIPDIMGRWKASIEQRLGMSISVNKLILGDEFPVLPDGVDGDIQDFFDLVSLANSIHKEGLTNPIAVVAVAPDTNLLIAGERRFLAFHLLLMSQVTGAKSKIPCRVLAKKDVWAQASENGARKPLNAIGMARQLALLIMDMYQDEGDLQGVDEFIKNDRPDREFYAQVANGTIWRVKKGMTQRILDVTGLKTREMIGDYRKLLSIDNPTWEQADTENWTLNRIHTYMGWVTPKQDMWEISYISEQKPSQDTSDKSNVSAPQAPSYDDYMSDISDISDEDTSVITDVYGGNRSPVTGMPRPDFTPPTSTPRNETPNFPMSVPIGNPSVQMPPKPQELAVQMFDKVVNASGVVMLVRSKAAGGVYVSKSMLEMRNSWTLWLWGTFQKIEKEEGRLLTAQEKDDVMAQMTGDVPLTSPRVQYPAPQQSYAVNNPDVRLGNYALAPNYLVKMLVAFRAVGGTNDYTDAITTVLGITETTLAEIKHSGHLSQEFERLYNTIALQFESYLKELENFLMDCANRANELE